MKRPPPIRIAMMLVSIGSPFTLWLGLGHLITVLGGDVSLLGRQSFGLHLLSAFFLLSSGAGGIYLAWSERRARLQREDEQRSDAIYERASEHVREAREKHGV